MTPLAGQTALVTGGAKRIGRAICEALAANGVNVAVHHNTSALEAESLAAELQQLGVRAIPVHADLTNQQSRDALFNAVLREFSHVDILVNSASIFPADTLAEVSMQSIAANFDVNTVAPLELSRSFAAQNRPGSIVNLLDARMVDYDKQHLSYHLSKRALWDLTRMCALEFAPLVRVNGVAPGLVLPPAGKDIEYLENLKHTNPLNRHGSPEEVARAVLFLLESSFITGQVIFVDGGRHLRGRVYE